jgi:uroporphyrinogen-III synthase
MIYLLSPSAKEGTFSLPMITFTLLDAPLEVAHYDLLMFTSKQAVISANMCNSQWKTIPTLAIGDATAKQIEALGGTVRYKPKSFYGEVLAEDILHYFKEKKILYIRPKKVSFDAKAFLEKSGVHLDEKILYETTCICYESKHAPEKNAIIIFTSPSTIECFFKNFNWDTSYTAIVIGTATKVHLPKEVKVFVAKEALISSCIAKAKEVLTANQL